MASLSSCTAASYTAFHTISGPPDTIVIRGKVSDIRGTGKSTRNGSWEDVPLSKIVARNGWTPACTIATKVSRADQLHESGFSFVTRLAKQYDCTAKVGDGKLMVMQRQAGLSASGKVIGAITITRSDVGRWQSRRTRPWRPSFRTKARLAAFNRSTAGVRLEMPGRTDLFAERSSNAQGFKVGLDSEYLVDSVEQTFTQAGWSTTVECGLKRALSCRDRCCPLGVLM